MKPSEVFAATRAKLATPERWTRGVFARNVAGDQCADSSPEAVCWCLLGAINSFFAPNHCAPDSVLRFVHLAIGNNAPIDVWQDDPIRTHHDILVVLSRACAYAQKEGC